MSFSEYIQHGWKLCLVPQNTKGPRNYDWNTLEAVERSSANAEKLVGAGLCHSLSGTCAIDVDNWQGAEGFLAQHGINLQALFDAPDAVQISSGRSGRGKLVYRLDTPLHHLSINKSLELRCQARTGRTIQDVLPPTIHPDTGKPYQWIGDWRKVPPIPSPLLALWQKLLAPEKDRERLDIRPTAKATELRDLLARRDPNCGYDEWLRIGMACHHETGGSDEGLAIWDEWSANGEKYSGLADLRSHWASFGRSATPITADSLRRMDRATASDFEDVSAVAALPENALDRPKVPEYRFLPLLELFQRPEPSWIVKDLLPEAALGVIYGQWGSGKTFIETDIALSIALGQPWRGRSVKQGRVLIVAAEDNRGIQIRLHAGLACRGAQDAPVRVLPAAPNLTDPGKQKALLEAIQREERPSLVFFDTLTKVIAGADENSGQDMGRVLEYCTRIHDLTGSMVILVHHEGKTPGRGMRGWSGLPDACDMIWELSKDEMQHELKVEKVKNAADGQSYGFRLLPVGKSCIVEWI